MCNFSEKSLKYCVRNYVVYVWTGLIHSDLCVWHRINHLQLGRHFATPSCITHVRPSAVVYPVPYTARRELTHKYTFGPFLAQCFFHFFTKKFMYISKNYCLYGFFYPQIVWLCMPSSWPSHFFQQAQSTGVPRNRLPRCLLTLNL